MEVGRQITVNMWTKYTGLPSHDHSPSNLI